MTIRPTVPEVGGYITGPGHFPSRNAALVGGVAVITVGVGVESVGNDGDLGVGAVA